MASVAAICWTVAVAEFIFFIIYIIVQSRKLKQQIIAMGRLIPCAPLVVVAPTSVIQVGPQSNMQVCPPYPTQYPTQYPPQNVQVCPQYPPPQGNMQVCPQYPPPQENMQVSPPYPPPQPGFYTPQDYPPAYSECAQK